MFIWFNRIRSSKIIRYCIFFICLNVPSTSSPYAFAGIIQWVLQAAPKVAEVVKAITTTTQGAATAAAALAAVALGRDKAPSSPVQPAPQPPTPVPAAQPAQAQPTAPSAPSLPCPSLLDTSKGKTPEVLTALAQLKKQPSMMTDKTAYDLLRKTREAPDAVKIPPVTKLQEAPKGTLQDAPVRMELREIEPITIKLFDSQTQQPPPQTPTIGHARSPAKPAGHVPSNQQWNNQETGFKIDAKITINKREHNYVTDETRQSAAELQQTMEAFKNGTGFNPGKHNESVGEKNGYTVADVNKGILQHREQQLREEQLAKQAFVQAQAAKLAKAQAKAAAKQLKKDSKLAKKVAAKLAKKVASEKLDTEKNNKNQPAQTTSTEKTAHTKKQDDIMQAETVATAVAPAVKTETVVETSSKIETPVIPLVEKPVEVVAPVPVVMQEAPQPQMVASSSNQWNDSLSESDSGADYLVMAYAAHKLQKWASGDTLHANEKLKTQPQQQHPLSSDSQQNQSPSQDPEDDEKDPKKKKNDVAVAGQALKKLKDELEKKKNEIDQVQWNRYKNKHVPKKDMPWQDVIENTKHPKFPAKYKHDVNQEQLELLAWEKGIRVNNPNNLNNAQNFKVFKCNRIIGAKNGIETPYLRVENSGNTIHGHPITPQEFFKYTKPIE